MLFDTHFHLDLVKDPKLIAAQIEEQEIYTFAVTNLPEVYSHTEKLCEGLNYIRPALGYHPELAARYPNQLELFATLIKRTRYIGEIGLDNLRKSPEDYQKQKEIFEHIIRLCKVEKNKILTVHSRRSERDVIDIIGENFPGKVILHWFSGSVKHMEIAAEQGFYFSVNLNMARSENGRRLIAAMPPGKILLETDGPFTTLGDSPCMPAHTSLIAREIAQVRNQPVIDFKNNFKMLLTEI